MWRPIFTLCASAALAGCAGIQSVLDPASPHAAALARLGWVMFAGALLISLLVLGLTAWALWAPPERRRWLAGHRAVVVGGLVFPLVVLTLLFVWVLRLMVPPADGARPVRIQVVGEQWWWRVIYLDEAGEPLFVTANEIRLPSDRPAELILTSADVIHSFWVPPLAGKLDMIPGHTNILRVGPAAPGTYRGQCAEYCGGAHALMALMVVVAPPEAHAAWVEAQRRPAAPPADPFLARGAALFQRSGCGTCHAIRGTPAAGRAGPDLTHVGSRLTIGAGILPNHAGTLAGWVADAPALKPELRMPAFPIFEGEELRALAAYLESLR